MTSIPVDRLLTQPMTYHDNSPPVIFRSNRDTEWVGLIPVVTARMINDMANLAQASAARTYVFNIMSMNNWDNAEFRDAVGVAFTFLEYFVRVMNNNLDRVFDQSIQLACRTVVATQIRDNNQLAGFCNQEILNAGGQALNSFNEANRAVQAHLNNEQSRNTQYAILPLNPFSSFTPSRVSVGTPVATSNGMRVSHANMSEFARESENKHIAKSTSRFAAHVDVAKQQQAEAQAARMALEEERRARELAIKNSSKASQLVWKSSELQRYPVWVDPFLEGKILKEEYTNSGNKCVIEQIVLLEEKEMRKQQHDLPLYGYTANLPRGSGVPQDKALKDAQTIALQKKEAEEIIATLTDKSTDIKQVSLPDDSDFFWVSSIDQLIFQTHLEGARGGTDTARCWGSVAKYIPFSPSRRPKVEKWFSEIRAAKSLTELSKVFLDVRAHPINHENRYPKAVYGPAEFYFRRLEQEVTDTVNEVLNIQMSIPATMDSFHSDYEDMLTYVEKNYSRKYLEILLNEEPIILNRFQAQFEGDTKELISVYAGNESESDGELYLDGTVDNYSITVMPYTAADLGLHCLTEAVLVTQSRQPALHMLIKNTMEVAKKTGLPYTAHYLVMLCGTKLRMHKGLLTNDSYLISN